VSLCLKGGEGVNSEGIRVSDPNSIQVDRPYVFKNCVNDLSETQTIGISQPMNVQATQTS